MTAKNQSATETWEVEKSLELKMIIKFSPHPVNKV